MEALLIVKGKKNEIFKISLDKYEEEKGIIHYSYLGIDITIKATKIKDNIFEVNIEQIKNIAKLISLNRIKELNDILAREKIRSIKENVVYFIRIRDNKEFHGKFFYFETIKEEDLKRKNLETFLINLDEIHTKGRIRLEEDTLANKEIIDVEVVFQWIWNEKKGWILIGFYPIDEEFITFSIFDF